MSLTLYRKYRPQTFAELVGQNHIKTTLQNEIEMDQVAHAYLFAGPRGTGKTTTARLIAKAVNCLNRKPGESEPCNVCDSCQEIVEGRSLDMIEIDAASHTGVDNVRENIINNSRFVPSQRKFKVFIIDEVHMLSISAFNALLKTLEEPPAHAIFILATTGPHKLPPTIISRCQRFDFHKVNLDELMARISELVKKEEREVDDQVIELIARQAEGCVRDAESLLGQVLALGEQKITRELAQLVIPLSDFNLVLELISYLVNQQAEPAINLINRLVEEGVDLKIFTNHIIEGLRKILLIKSGANLADHSLDLVKDQEAKLEELAKNIKLAELVSMIDIFEARRQELRFAKISQLPLELAIVEIVNKDNPGATGQKSAVVAATVKGKTPKKVSVLEDNLAVAKSIKQERANRFQPVISDNSINGVTPRATAKCQVKKTKGKKGLVVCSLEMVKEKWGEVLAKVKEYNHTLFSFLRVNQPVGVIDDVIQIGVVYKFHQERINELKNRQVLEKVLSEILGQPVRVECVLVAKGSEQPDFVKEDRAIQNLLEEFGGQVVE